MTYRIIFSYTNYLCDGTCSSDYSLCVTVYTDNESLNPVRVLYHGLCGKEHLLAGKNSIIFYDALGKISAVYTDIRFAD